MNRRYKRMHHSFNIKKAILNSLENNLKEYLVVSIIFFIGVIIGVIFINKSSESQKEEITSYICSFITNLKDANSVDEVSLLANSIKKNIMLTIFLWFMGSTIIGISIVYLTVCFRGFCLGYTISSIIQAIGMRKRFFCYSF